MTTWSRPTPLAIACVLAVAGCSTLTSGDPSTIDTATRSFKPITPSPADTCDTQRQVAEHNAVYDTLKGGKPVTYRAWCDELKRRDAPKRKPEPATS